ncbi:LPD5 domain-containing protein [Candidatus Avelusimicrobium faecicola]|uniref:LPD5 domain-containing protein n=1 Tax=Candidatus Avelusimicrobium faecicola TaxID=3416205 RepID=UPI003CBACEBF|nr:LPD5 domain-containing protein [Spirochaetota bacterium]
MNEQEQTAKTPFTTPAPFATLEPERRSIYLPEEQLIVNTTLQRAEEVNYALQTELYKKAKDNFFAFKRLDESIPDTTHRWWKTPLRAVADSGVSMWQAGERLMAGGIGAILDEYEYMKQDSAARKKYRELYQQLNEQAPDVESRKEALSAQAEQEFNQIRQDYEHNRKLGRDALLVMSQNHAKFRELAGIAKDERDGFLYDLFGAGGSLMAAIGLTVLTGSPAAAAIAFGATAGQQDYEEALQNGVAPERALRAGLAGGAFEGGIELLGMEMLLKSLTKTGVLGRIAASALSEGSEEAAQQTAEEIIMQNFGGRQQELADTLQGIGYSFVIGSLTAVPVATLVNRASKKLQDKGIKKETADKMALNMAKETATPENNAEVHKILSNATSPLVYPHGDVEQGAQAFKESIDKARNPDRETTRKMYEVAERTEQKALAAGYDTTSAALMGNLEQSRANSVLNVAGLKPGEFEMTEVDFENAPVQDNTQAVQDGVAAQREKWAKEYEEYQARKAQAKAAADAEFDRKLAEVNLQPEDILFQSAAMYKNKANSLVEFKDFAVNNKGNKQEDNKSFYRFTNKDGVQIDVPFERALHIKEKHHLTDQQLDVAEKELNNAEYAVLMPDVGEYQGKQVKIKVNTSLGKMGAVLEILPNGRVFLDTAFFDSDAHIDNWAKENHPNAPSKKPVFIGSGIISIADIMREIKGNNRGTFDSANPNIYLKENIENVRPSIADLFAPKENVVEEVHKNISDYEKGTLPIWVEINLGTPSVALTSVGVPAYSLKLKQKTIKKDTQTKNAVKIETFKRLPELLADPVMLLKSDTVQNSFVAVLNDFDRNGKRLVAAIDPDGTVEVNLIDSVYGKNNVYWFKNQVEKGKLLYIDEKEALKESSHLYLRGVPYKASTNRILTKEDVVKAQESGKTNNPSELLQENLFNIQQNLFDKQQSLLDTQANAEERTELTQEDSELKEAADGLFTEEELKQDLPPFTPTGKPERIEDFGEKILGARKDMWGKYRAAMTSELPADVREITLSKYFPEPNYEAAIAKGITTEQLAIVKALRDSIPAKPQLLGRAARWAEGLKAARETANQVLQHPEMVNLFKETDKTDAIHNRVAFYLEIGYPAFTKAKDYTLRSSDYLMYGGTRFNTPTTIYELERGYKRVAGSQNRAEMVALARKMLTETAAPAKAPTKLDVYQRRDTGEIIIGKKIATGKFIDLKGGFERVKDAFDFLTKNQAHLEALLAEKRKIYPVRRDTNAPRVGKEYRPAGTVITPERFSQEFGFRGVQFGNWVEQERRAQDLNNAYDALLDMADIIRIPARAVSLDGTLGLAFGARGKANELAHYERDHVVINLNKKNGAGSLGHEWWHALDNYFSRQDGQNEMTSENPKANSALRPEMKEAYQGVLKAITDTFYSRSVNLDKLRSKPYWSTRTEMTARAFESYLVYKAKQEGHSNDYLANIVNPEAYLGGKERFPYPTDTEMPAIAAAFDRFFNTLKTAETPRGYTLYAESDEGDTSFNFGQNVAQPDFLGKVVFAQDSNRAIIVASTSANESTAIHEYFHVWERDLYRAEKVSTEPEFLQMMQDLRQIHAGSAPFVMEYLGKTKLLNDTARARVLQTIKERGGDEYIKRLAFNDSLDENDTTAQFVRRGFRENFATKAEKYFHNGKAPNATYKSLFDKFAAWLRDIYGALTGVDLSPEVQEFFDKLLAKEARRVDSKLFTGKVDKLKQQINNIRQGSPRGDFTLEQIKDLVSTLDAPAPKLPTNHLLKDLRRYGAEYANAGQIDKEAYKNARVFNKKGGIGDDPARWLADHGYLTEAEGRTYEEQDRINQQAYDLIDRALNGEVIYPIGTEKQIADFENYKSLMDTMREAWGDPREAKKTLKAILDLEEKGYRVVEKRDLADFSLRLGELNRLAERLDNKSQTVQNKEQASAATLDAARKIKRHLITELNKRQIEGKDGLIKQLEKAKTFEEIQTAAAGALDFLEDAYDRTNEGQEERRRTDLPNTNWDNVRAELLRAYSESIGHVDEKIQQAWRVLNMASSGQLKLYENLTDEEVARRRTAAEKVLKEAEPKLEAALMRAMESVLRKQGGLESDQVHRLVAKYARSASRQRSLWKHEIDELIKQTREIQEDNYKQYMNKKIQALLNMNLFDRRGNFRRAMTDPTTMSALEELRRVAHLGPQSAADELQNRMLVDKPNSLIDRIINEMLSIQAYARKDVTCQLFKQAYEDIHSLRKAGRDAKILEKMIKDFRTEQDKSEVLGAIKKNKQAGKLKQMYASWIANWESFLDMVTDKETKEKYSMLNLESDTITYTWQRRTEIMDGVKRIYGLGSNRELQNKMNALRNEKYTFTNYALVDKNTNPGAIKRTGEAFPEELNKLQIIDAYIYAKNDNLMDRLLNQYGGQLNDMFALLDKQDRALGDFLQKEAEKTYAQINSVFVKERGYDLPRVENYFPSKTERVESELDFLNAAAAMSKNPSFTKMRASSAFVQMKLENPFGILFTHIDRAADYTFKAEKLNQIIRVFKSPVLKPAIIEKVGEDCYKRMLELIDQFSVSKPRLNYEMDKLGDWLTNNYVKGAIALKPTIAVKQLISSINYAENMPASQWVSGFAKAIMHPKETVEFMMSGDPYLKARYESGSMNEALARATADANALTARGKFLRFTDLLTINTRLGDVGAIMFGGKPYVDYLMQTKGMSKKEAFAEFRKSTLRSQQANTRSSLSTLQARDMNFIVRGLFAFKNTPAQYARKIADAIYEYQRGEIFRAQLAKVVAIYGLFNSWMYSALTTLGILAWYYDDDDADEILADELFFSPFVQMAGCLPVLDMAVGTAAEVAKAKMFDHKVRMERPELPVVSDLFKMGQTAVKDDLAAEDVLNMLVESGQLIGGLPTKYAKGFYTGAGDIAGGENPMRGFLQMLGYTENRAHIATNTKK